jgi:hypothetical protein
MHPVKRLGAPEEVSALAGVLLRREATFITAFTHLVDGATMTQVRVQLSRGARLAPLALAMPRTTPRYHPTGW